MDLSGYFSNITEERLARFQKVASLRSDYYTFVFDNFYDPHNISAALRSIEGLGFQEVHLVTGKNPMRMNKAITRGCTKWLDVHVHEDVSHCYSELEAKGYKILVADPNEDGLTVDDLSGESRIAFVFGEELYGISPEARKLSHGSFRIVMRGFVESFNVSVSVALTAFAARLNCERNLEPEQWLMEGDRRKDLTDNWLIKNTVIGRIIEEECHE